MLNRNSHCAFPVIEEATEQVRGLITRNQLITLIANKAFSKTKVIARTVPKFSMKSISVINRTSLNMIDGADPLEW